MQEIGNITAFVSFHFLLVLMAFWLLLSIILYNEINSNEDKINYQNRKRMIPHRSKGAIAVSPLLITAISLLNIGFLAIRIHENLVHSIIAIALNVIFCIGAIVSLVLYVKLKSSSNKDAFKIKKYNYILAFTTIVILAADVYTFFWSR